MTFLIASIYYLDEEHYDIKGKNYQLFLEKCFLYSEYFSLISPRERQDEKKYSYISDDLSDYVLIQKNTFAWPGNIILKPYDNKYNQAVTYSIYKCCNDTRRILEEASPSLFSWCDGRPEDLTFYYSNKKIFLYSVAHEATCRISCAPVIFKEFVELNLWTVESEDKFIEEIYF